MREGLAIPRGAPVIYAPANQSPPHHSATVLVAPTQEQHHVKASASNRMNKITRLNWFKKVFGGAAALCAWPLFAKGRTPPAAKATELVCVSLPKYRTVLQRVMVGTDMGDITSIRPFLNVFRDHRTKQNTRMGIPIWLERIPENISEFGLMERMIYGKPLANQTLSSWQELETRQFQQCLTYEANMVGLVELLCNGNFPEGNSGEVVIYEVFGCGQRWVGVYADSEGAARDFIKQFLTFIAVSGHVPPRTI